MLISLFENEDAMTRHIKAPLPLIAAMLTLAVCLLVTTGADAQVRVNPNPVPKVSINASCQADRAVFKIRNGLREHREPVEIIILAEQERRIMSRRSMRFKSLQKATYRVPLTGRDAIEGALRIILMSGGDARKPLAHARLDCEAG